jgi:hypothetical protein
MGNLTLVSGALNTSMSNSARAGAELKPCKGGALNLHIVIRMYRRLLGQFLGYWPEDISAIRADILFEEERTIWPSWDYPFGGST